MNALTTFDSRTRALIIDQMQAQHSRLAQLGLDRASRSTSALNYDSALKALGDYLDHAGEHLPTKSVLSSWRDDMLAGRAPIYPLNKDTDERDPTRAIYQPYSVRSVNARLSAVRKLLRAIADDVTDLTVKMVLNDWAKVEDAKATALAAEDKTESDYGRRLTIESLTRMIHSIDTTHLKGLRDRALIAVMAGAGLRVSEACKVTLRDVFLTENESGQRGIRVRQGKHNKSRIVVLNGWNSWIIEAVQAYTDALGLTPLENPDAVIFRGVKIAHRGKQRQATAYNSEDKPLTPRNAERAVNEYQAEHAGAMVVINCHDLRRTYAKLCKQSGMSWEALRANMGHSSVMITEAYVGKDVDWSERVPNWTIKL